MLTIEGALLAERAEDDSLVSNHTHLFTDFCSSGLRESACFPEWVACREDSGTWEEFQCLRHLLFSWDEEEIDLPPYFREPLSARAVECVRVESDAYSLADGLL